MPLQNPISGLLEPHKESFENKGNPNYDILRQTEAILDELLSAETEEYLAERICQISARNNIVGAEIEMFGLSYDDAIAQLEQVYSEINQDMIISAMKSLADDCREEYPQSKKNKGLLMDAVQELEVYNKNIEDLEAYIQLHPEDQEKICSILNTWINEFSNEPLIMHQAYLQKEDTDQLMSKLQIMVTQDEGEMGRRIQALIDEYKMNQRRIMIENGDIDDNTYYDRGRIYWCKMTIGVGFEISGARGILVLTNNNFIKKSRTVTGVLMHGRFSTFSQDRDIHQSDLSHTGPFYNGRDMCIEPGQIVTVDKNRLVHYVATVNSQKMSVIDRLIKQQLNL